MFAGVALQERGLICWFLLCVQPFSTAYPRGKEIPVLKQSSFFFFLLAYYLGRQMLQRIASWEATSACYHSSRTLKWRPPTAIPNCANVSDGVFIIFCENLLTFVFSRTSQRQNCMKQFVVNAELLKYPLLMLKGLANEIKTIHNSVDRIATAVITDPYKCLFLFTLTNSAETTKTLTNKGKHATEKY